MKYLTSFIFFCTLLIMENLSAAGCHLFVYGDFLYWKANVSNLPYAVFAETETVPPGFQFVNHESVEKLSFNYDPGFRIGLGGQFDVGWDVLVDWTRFHTSAHVEHVATPPDLIFPLWDIGLPAQINHIDASQFLHFDEIELILMRDFPLGMNFSLAPSFGAVYATIRQRLKIREHQVFDPPSVGTNTTIIKNNFAGGGLRAGLQANYSPTNCLNLYGKGSYSLLYGKFNLSLDAQDDVNIPPLLSFMHNQFTREFSLVHAFDLMVGLENSWNFSIFQLIAHIGYEFVFWPDQVRVPRIHSDISTKTPITELNEAHGNIGFHGLTAGLIFSF